ncbi:MAG: hypothetical protein NTW83_13325 [Cyanobacteria bacterium]|nr:hypothetical protein [Cyanobacteriota bacterium]
MPRVIQVERLLATAFVGRGSGLNHQDRAHLASLLGETQAVAVLEPEQAHPVAAQPKATGPAGPWRVTASISGGLVQISNNHESRVIRKAEVETYLRKGKPW